MILSDLKHVLENVNHSNDIELKTPMRFINANGNQRRVLEVKKIGKSWKVIDDYGKVFTLSGSSNAFQSNLYSNCLSMFDTRCKPKDWNPKILG